MIIPYGKQSINKSDVDAVVKALKSDYLTTGPLVKTFEGKFANFVGAKYAVAVSSGTAALHVACLAAGLKKKDELITSPMTFAASANCALYCGAKPVFVDVKESNGLIDEDLIPKKITKNTKIIIPVHLGGLPANLEKIKKIALKNKLIVIEDACHALGSKYKKSKIGDCKYSDMAVFSFHPVKHITTAEGGMITTNSKKLYGKLLLFRTHGITKEPKMLTNKNVATWYYEMLELGFNYRMTDMQSALGLSQLKRVNKFIKKRLELAKLYDKELSKIKGIHIIKSEQDVKNAYHLYIVKTQDLKVRMNLFNYLYENGIHCQVHYIPVYWHPYYQKLGYEKGLCPMAERFYEKIISIPIYPDLSSNDQKKVVGVIKRFYEK